MDRISDLPNELLSHILSFVTTKEAALTSILARRWRNLIAFVPNLDIDDTELLYGEDDKRHREEIIQSFMSFVDRILTLQGNSPVEKVFISCRSKVDPECLDVWIHKVLERGVSELDLLINRDRLDDEDYRLSPKCFQCSTLVYLKIGCGIDVCWDVGLICLPVLKTFVLDSARVGADKFENLLLAMPSLEELVLDNVIWKNMDLCDLTVSSASVKKLTIHLCADIKSVSFNTPRLVYFMYSGDVPSDFPVVNTANIFEAKISFDIYDWDLKRVREPFVWLEDDEDNATLGFSNVWKFFFGVRNVRNLALSPDTLELLSLSCESMPVFNNLKWLAITSAVDRGWQAMPVLLKSCPHLETLVIEVPKQLVCFNMYKDRVRTVHLLWYLLCVHGLLHDVTDKCGDACVCIYRDDRGLSLTSCPVKVLVIRGFRATMKEMCMIKHFLDYFPCLKEMVIYLAEDGLTQFENHEVRNLIHEMFYYYIMLSRCNVQLLVSDAISEKWMKNKTIA